MYFPFGPMPEHKNVRRALLLFVTTFISLPVFAQQSIPLTLAEAEDRALVAEPGQQALQAFSFPFFHIPGIAGLCQNSCVCLVNSGI